MKQKAILYTTSKGKWIQDRIPYILECLNKSQGRTVTTIDIVTVKEPYNPLTFRDSDGDTRFMWDWFDKQFPANGYDVVGFHFTSYYKMKWGLAKRIKGTYHKNHGGHFDFWFCADSNERSKTYGDMDEFTRLFLHEWAHGDSYMADNVTGVPRDFVHKWDYSLKAIHLLTFDFTQYNIRKQIVHLLDKVLSTYVKIFNAF